MKINPIEKLIGSAFYTGFIPFASGTFGSLAALIIYLIPGFENPTVMIFAISIATVLGIRIGNKFENIYGKDPAECTIDEVVGMWISLILLPKKIWIIAVTFVIWRLLDIIKPFPARNLEKLPGGFGIMFDDIASGIYTLFLMHIIVYFIN